MAIDQEPRRLSGGHWAALGVAILLGVGIPYSYTYLMPKRESEPPKPAPKQPTAPPPPLVLSLVGDASGDGQSADLAPDDAKIIWLKTETPSRRRMRFLPLSITDERGLDFAYSVEGKNNGLIAVHIKRGYDVQPKTLTLKQLAPQGRERAAGASPPKSPKILGTIKDLPAPSVVLAPAPVSQGYGEVQIARGRGGRLSPFVHITKPLPKDEGLILKPVASTYATIVSPADNPGLISSPGEQPFDARLNFPNPVMAKQVSFQATVYKAVETTETVTLQGGRIESKFGQPTFVVDRDVVVTTPSGLKITMPSQDYGPKRQPKRVHSSINVRFIYDTSGLKDSVAGIGPTIGVSWLSPTFVDLGLQTVQLSFGGALGSSGEKVFGQDPQPILPPRGNDGKARMGPIAITLKISVRRAKAVSQSTIRLAVNSKLQASLPSTLAERGGSSGGPPVAPGTR